MKVVGIRRFAALVGVGLIGMSGLGRGDEGPPPPPAKTAPGEPDPGEDEAPPPKAPDLVPPTPDLAPLLAPSEDEAEPSRELKRAFLSALHYLLARDLDRMLPYYHPDFRMHVGQGEFEAAPPEVLRELLVEQFRHAGAQPRIALADVLVPESLRVLSFAAASKPVPADEAADQPIDPERVARWMQPGDWLVLARLDQADLPEAVFYVFRRHAKRFKIVLGE